MGLINRPTKSTSGSSEYADDTPIRYDELNDDINPIYVVLNGGLDDDNVASLSIGKITGTVNPERIDDTSASQAEHDTTQDPGDVDSPPTTTTSRTLPTNVEDELQQLRYGIGRLALGNGVVRRDTAGPTNENAAWFEHPARGRNLIVNGYFNIPSPFLIDLYDTGGPPQNSGSPDGLWDQDGTTTLANRAPAGWSLTATPTVVQTAYRASATTGEGLELQVTSDAASEGITQTVTGLKASTRYLLRVRGRANAGDTINITTTGASGAVYGNAVLTLPNTNDGTVSSILVTDATPTDIVVSILSSAASDNFFLRSVELLELSEDPIPVAADGYTTQATLSESGAVNSSAYTNIGGLERVVICPGPGYEIVVTAALSFNVASGQVSARITEGGAAVRTLPAGETGSTTIVYVNEAPTAGTTYTYRAQAYTGGSASVSPNLGGTFGQQDSTLTVEVRRRG